MRFTKELVRQVADRAEKFTGGAFSMSGVGMSLGNGVRYIDGTSSLIWLGREGSRCACAYYIGAILGWARSTGTIIKPDDMHFLKAVQDAYAIGSDPAKATYRQWEAKGFQAAQNRAA